MTPSQEHAQALLDAVDEGYVLAVIDLYDKEWLEKRFYTGNRMADLLSILAGANRRMTLYNPEYWLDRFGVKNEEKGT